jgi:hypothetical protein
VKEVKPQTSKRAEKAPPRKRKPSESHIEEEEELLLLFLKVGLAIL